MISSEVQRTLVKSPPELWSELSDPDALARHLGELGEIRITRTEPEKLVEWEAQGSTGTVAIKASGWGTKVTLTVHHEPAGPEPAVAEPAAPEPAMAEDYRRSDTPLDEDAVSANPKPAPATEAARRAAGWPDVRGQAGPAIESDLRAAEEDAPISEHAPWHLEENEHALQAKSVREPLTETDPPAESRRGFFARLFGSRRKRVATAVADPGKPTDLAAEQPQVTPPVANSQEPSTTSHTQMGAEGIRKQADTDTDAALDALTAPETGTDDSAVANAEAEGSEPAEAGFDVEPPSESHDLAAELKAAEEIAAEQVEAVLTSVLDRLGAAHHRPFSRA